MALPSGQAASSFWGGTASATSGALTISPQSYDATIPPGGSVTVGYVAATKGAAGPSTCAVTPGGSCLGLGSTSTTTSAPSPSTTTSTTAPPTSPTTTSPTTTTTTSTSSTPTSAGALGRVTPYADITLSGFSLPSVTSASGLKSMTLAFVTSGGGCTPSWGGVTPVSQAPMAGDIKALRASGGDVRISFGGAAGTELAQACTSATSLAAAYQAVLDTYSATAIDFDIEGAAVADVAGNTRRNQAINILRQHAVAKGADLQVSYTLAVLPSGLTGDGIAILKNAAANSTRVDSINVMAMDYGASAAPSPAGRMGDYAIAAVTGSQAQVRSIWPSLSDAQAWAKMAVTPMIGVNDQSDEIFTVADATKLVAFARTKHLAWLGFWSLGRDHQCSQGAVSYADATCSSILQSNYAFSSAFKSYTG